MALPYASADTYTGRGVVDVPVGAPTQTLTPPDTSPGVGSLPPPPPQPPVNLGDTPGWLPQPVLLNTFAGDGVSPPMGSDPFSSRAAAAANGTTQGQGVTGIMKYPLVLLGIVAVVVYVMWKG